MMLVLPTEEFPTKTALNSGPVFAASGCMTRAVNFDTSAESRLSAHLAMETVKRQAVGDNRW
jgi:hypothetical protein